MNGKYLLTAVAIAAALALCIGTFVTTDQSSADTSGTCGDHLTWVYTEDDHTLTISGYGDMVIQDGRAPWYSFREEIQKVIMPEGLTSIGNHAFDECTFLASVDIPSSVTSIGEEAFYCCTSLTSVSMPSVTSIGKGAFILCNSLTSVAIPSSVTYIGKYAFTSCDRLTEIDVDENNTEYSSSEGILYNKDMTVLIQCPAGFGSASLTIPSSVTVIGNQAFYDCHNLKSITIPSSVTSIDEEAFRFCSLTSVDIPPSVTSIGEYAFGWCTSLTSITILSSVTSIGEYAFEYCISLTSVTLPSSVTYVGAYAFYYCRSLESVDIPSVTSIGDGAFGWCTSLTTIAIPSSVTSIGEDAFYGSSIHTVYDCSGLISPGSYGLSDDVVIIHPCAAAPAAGNGVQASDTQSATGHCRMSDTGQSILCGRYVRAG